jgi:hypothetical protein
MLPVVDVKILDSGEIAHRLVSPIEVLDAAEDLRRWFFVRLLPSKEQFC